MAAFDFDKKGFRVFEAQDPEITGGDTIYLRDLPADIVPSNRADIYGEAYINPVTGEQDREVDYEKMQEARWEMIVASVVTGKKEPKPVFRDTDHAREKVGHNLYIFLLAEIQDKCIPSKKEEAEGNSPDEKPST